MKTYVINLPRAKARRDAMERQFQDIGQEFELFHGTDWRQLSSDDWHEVDRISREREGRRPLTPGMVACHLSHRRVLRKITTGDEEWAAVFEDDVSLSPELGAALRELEAATILSVFDIIFLHRNHGKKSFVPLAAVNDHFTLGLVRFADWGTQSYVVSRNAAQRILERFPKIVHRTDHTLHAYWENSLATAYLDPPVAFHGIADARGSLLKEGADNRRRRMLLSGPRRFCSAAVEEFRKRKSFGKRIRSRI